GGVVGFLEALTGKECAPQHSPPEGFSRKPGWLIPSALTNDGQTVACVDADDAIQVWETATGKRLACFGAKLGTNSLAFSPDGKTVAVPHSDQTIRLWDVATGKQVLQFGAPRKYGFAVFSPDGMILATAHSDRTIRLWETATGKALHLFRWE